MESFILKDECRRRLNRLFRELYEVLREDADLNVKSHPSLLPALFSVYTYLWCKRWTDLLKRVTL